MRSIECPLCGRITSHSKGLVMRHKVARIRNHKQAAARFPKPITYFTKEWCEGGGYSVEQARAMTDTP